MKHSEADQEEESAPEQYEKEGPVSVDACACAVVEGESENPGHEDADAVNEEDSPVRKGTTREVPVDDFAEEIFHSEKKYEG